MILFKAAGTTYRRVVRQSLHAFPYSPEDAPPGQLVLLSKNKKDCAHTEKQIQNVAKLLSVRPATPKELDERFPGVEAGARWRYIAELYWLTPLDRPFSLPEVPGLNYKRYDTVQEFARLDQQDEYALFHFLGKTNEHVVLGLLNRSDLPPSLQNAED